MLKKLLNLIFSRMVVTGALIVLQIITLIAIILKFSRYQMFYYAFFGLLSIAVVLWIVNSRDNPGYKLALVIPILLFPVFGGLFYLIFGTGKYSKKQQKRIQAIHLKLKPLLKQDVTVLEKVRLGSPAVAAQMEYIRKNAGFPVYLNSQTEYYSVGESFFEAFKKELLKAEQYIFLEYFIIKEGVLWNQVLDILVDKAKNGVDVRVIFDDIGCLPLLPSHYDRYLNSLGIQCSVFNPFVPVLSMWHNNRDHRKIAVIDGCTAFTGGINLSDEYINETHPHGHWKDVAIRIKGEAAWSFTVMFLGLWNELNQMDEDFSFYRPVNQIFASDGYVMPYGDDPLNNETVGENVYLNLINHAHRYVYICTPYFIVDNETVTALCLAAKSGLDVRLITPHIEDKWYVHMVTRSYYPLLIENGVRVYEYTPGFIHAKTVVSDDLIATVGSINFDYRSLYLQFECGVLLYKTRTIQALREDFENTLSMSQEISLEECKRVPIHIRFMRSLMRLFAPLM